MKLVGMRIASKTAILIGAAALSMMLLTAALVVDVRHRIDGLRATQATTAALAALAMIEHAHSEISERGLSEADAKVHVLAQLRGFRFDEGEGYVAIVDDSGVNRLHPIDKNIEGRNGWEMQDPDGRYIVQEAIAIGKRDGLGLNTYGFVHPTSGEPDTKTSAIGRFDPWGWTVVTGVFDERIDAAILDLTSNALLLAGGLLAAFLTLSIAIARSLSLPMSALVDVMTRVANGERDAQVPYQGFSNEYGVMARALGVFQTNASRMDEMRDAQLETERQVAEDRGRMTAMLRDEFGAVLGAARRGDFSKRIDASFEDEDLRALSLEINALVETVEAGVGSSRRAIDALALGQLHLEASDSYEGAFADLQSSVSATAKKMKALIDNLRASAAEVRSDGETIAREARRLEERTGEQTRAIAVSSESVQQVSGGIRDNADGARQARDQAEAATSHARGGIEVVGRAVDAVTRIEQSSTEIGEIVSTIDGIAFQTNLLALNAAVEAARAGEAGKGFAVVASEVRSLAQRSSDAAREIRNLVSDSTDRVDLGVRLVRETGSALETIQTAISDATGRIAEISASTEQQADGVAEASRGFEGLEASTRANTKMAAGSVAAAQRLVDQSAALEAMIEAFGAGAEPDLSRAA